MIEFFAENWGTLLIGAVVAVVVSLVVRKLYRDKKQGKGTCSCGCSGCPSAGLCHKK